MSHHLMEQISKMWCIDKMEYYSAVKINEILIHFTVCMNLENILPSERSQ